MPRDLASRSAAILERRLQGLKPSAAVVLGSGLGGFADAIDPQAVVPYRALPGFPPADVEGHRGRLVAGTLAGVGVIALSGRAHAYEALPLDAYRVPVRTLRRLGVEILVLTNAAGSLRRRIGPGRLMLIRDHINLLGMNPLWGANDASYGPRFPAMKTPTIRSYVTCCAEPHGARASRSRTASTSPIPVPASRLRRKSGRSSA